MAVVMSVLTSQKGLLGLPAFLCSMGAPGVCYALAWAVLAMWAGKRKRKYACALRAAAFSGGLGTFLEVYASPRCTASGFKRGARPVTGTKEESKCG